MPELVQRRSIATGRIDGDQRVIQLVDGRENGEPLRVQSEDRRTPRPAKLVDFAVEGYLRTECGIAVGYHVVVREDQKRANEEAAAGRGAARTAHFDIGDCPSDLG